MIRGIIFDLDGTLGDTLPVCFAAFRETFRTYLGRNYSDAEIRAMFGPAEEGVLQRLIPNRGSEPLERYLTEYRKAHAVCTQPFPGIAEALNLLRQRGVKLGIVTGKGPRSAQISLEAMGLSTVFDQLEAGSPNGGVKPECMRRVLRAWGYAGVEVATLGDAPSDIRSSHEIGAYALGAAWARTADYHALEALVPHRIFRSVEEFAAWIQGGLERA